MTKEELAQIAQETSATIAEDTRKFVSETVVPELTEKVTAEVMAKVAKERAIGSDATKTDANKEFAENIRAVAKGEKQSFGLTRAAGDPPVNTQDAGSGKEIARVINAESIIKPTQKPGLVDRFAYHYPMAADTVSVPTVDAILAQRSREGELRSFGGLKTGVVNLHAATLSAIVPMTRELVDGAVEDMGSVFALLGSQAISLIRDKWALGLLGANEGILRNTAVQKRVLATGKTKYTDLSSDDLMIAYGMLDDATSPIFLTHRSVATNLAIEKTATGNPIWDWGLFGQGKTALGLPFETFSLLPSVATPTQTSTEFAALADMGSVVHGIAQSVEIQRADQAVLSDSDGQVLFNAFQQKMYFFMISVREDMVLYKPDKNFVSFKTGVAA
jgi:HK97 family phage major capsid protein